MDGEEMIREGMSIREEKKGHASRVVKGGISLSFNFQICHNSVLSTFNSIFKIKNQNQSPSPSSLVTGMENPWAKR